jgi:hypothetical protein
LATGHRGLATPEPKAKKSKPKAAPKVQVEQTQSPTKKRCCGVAGEGCANLVERDKGKRCEGCQAEFDRRAPEWVRSLEKLKDRGMVR